MTINALDQTDALFFLKTGVDRADTQRIVDEALAGVDDGELFLETHQAETLTWDDGRLKSATYNTSQGFGLRAVAGETVGFAHASTLDLETLRRAAGTVQAVKSGYAGTVSLAPQSPNRLLYAPENPLLSKTFEEKVALLQTIDAALRARDPRIAQVSLSLMAGWRNVQIMRAGGWRCADIRPMTCLNISVMVRQGDRQEVGASAKAGRVDYDFCFDPAVWQALSGEALRKALTNLEAVDAAAGEMTVVLGPGWPAVLLHEAIGHGLEGDAHRKKASAFAGLMGQRVAAEGVTVVDDGTIEKARGSLNFDDEGTPTRCTTLIENGILVGLMQDRLNARLMGTISTGNGRRENFMCQPYPRMTNTMMLAGAHTPEEIVASVTKGIYAADFGGGQVDITSGKFVFSATEAYEIENGKIGRPLKGVSLVGTGFESLKHMTMIGNNTKLYEGTGTCGKYGQNIPVGVAQPTIRLENMTVGGAAL